MTKVPSTNWNLCLCLCIIVALYAIRAILKITPVIMGIGTPQHAPTSITTPTYPKHVPLHKIQFPTPVFRYSIPKTSGWILGYDPPNGADGFGLVQRHICSSPSARIPILYLQKSDLTA